MQMILAIAGKDIRVYLTTWTSYILFGAFTFISSFFFTALVEQYQTISLQWAQNHASYMLEQMNLTDLVMGNVFRNVAVFFLFMLPILTMRLFAEERKGKTLELLMTVPVRPWQIVLGKYVAALFLMAIMLALTLIFPLLLTIYGGSATGTFSPLDWPTVWVGYLGMFLLGAACLSVGLFGSSITESQIVAVIISFAVLLLFFVIGFASGSENSVWQTIFSYVSITNHLENFIRGVIKLPAVVYYLSLALLGLFFTYRVVEAERWR